MGIKSIGLAACVVALSAGCGGKGKTRADAGPGCGDGGPCSSGATCVAGQCVTGGPLTITTATLPDGVVGQSYATTMAASGGKVPYRWAITQRAPALGWLALGADSGQLSGTPSSATSGAAAVQVEVEDAQGLVADKSFTLSVAACADGSTVTCFAPLPGGAGCGKGTATCTGGVPGACGNLVPSSDLNHCGASCGACDATTANACDPGSGTCACGSASACANGSSCCGAGGAFTCVDTTSDPGNCGGCNVGCPAPPNALPACVQSSCSYACIAGYDSCDPTKPCATDLNSSPGNCGACGNACDPTATNGCTNGSCGCYGAPQCAQGTACCGAASVLPNRCADLTTGEPLSGGSIIDCGLCGLQCAPPLVADGGAGGAFCNSTQKCDRRCDIDSAGNQWADCTAWDGGVTGGATACTTNLSVGDPIVNNSIPNCGGCGPTFTCAVPGGASGTPVCNSGKCGVLCTNPLQSICPGAAGCTTNTYTSSCGTSCEQCPTSSSQKHLVVGGSQCCGAFNSVDNSCTSLCPGPDGGIGSCNCHFFCDQTTGAWADCDNDALSGTGDGCEVDLNVGGSCSSIVCTPREQDGSIKNCGACGHTCSGIPNGVVGCSNGQCVVQSCNWGYADCDGVLANGCEAYLVAGNADSTGRINNCGQCNTHCPAPGAWSSVTCAGNPDAGATGSQCNFQCLQITYSDGGTSTLPADDCDLDISLGSAGTGCESYCHTLTCLQNCVTSGSSNPVP